VSAADWHRDHVEAVTFDFFDTLVFHRTGRGRGHRLRQYLEDHGYDPSSWCNERVYGPDGAIYRILERHADEYSPDLPHAQRRRYLERVARRAFDEFAIGTTAAEAARHALPLWEILGPSSLAVFPEVTATLRSLRAGGFRLAIISNWHCGLAHFVAELGLAPYFEHVIGSADCGHTKPGRRIFERASALLSLSPDRILHVGDTYEADYVAAREAGFHAALVARRSATHDRPERVIRTLAELGTLPELATALRA
jgi:HAD superfamily hydrolase (TIGR01549 family)